MIGTFINMIAVAFGSLIGLTAGARIPENTQSSIITGLGFITLSVGAQNSFQTGNILIPLFSLVLGVLVGEMLDLQSRLDSIGGWLQKRFASGGGDQDRFIQGFVTASLVFCIGPLTVLGSLQDGMSGDIELLVLKSSLDFFAAIAFAASLGVGVGFSAISIFLIQGGFALLGALAGEVMTDPMIDELTATGGLVMMGIALLLLDIKRLRMANYLPALFFAPLFVAILTAIGVDIYPNL